MKAGKLGEKFLPVDLSFYNETAYIDKSLHNIVSACSYLLEELKFNYMMYTQFFFFNFEPLYTENRQGVIALQGLE